MATALIHEIPTSGPDSLMPVSNKLQDRMNILREVIDSKKTLVRNVGEEMKQLIEHKTQLIFRELEAIWDEANQRMNQKKDEIYNEIEELNKHKAEMERIFKKLNQIPCFDQINESIESVKRGMNIDIPYVNLKWKVNELRESINTLCTCEQRIVKFVEDIHIPLKSSFGDRGELNEQIYDLFDVAIDLFGVAIDSINDRIYVADRETNRVQIFSGNGEWIHFLEEEIDYPENILILSDSIFVQSMKRICKFNKLTFEKESYSHLHYYLSGICTDNTYIFVGEWENIQLTVLTPELIEERRIPLNTQFKGEDTQLEDISLARDVFYIALTDTDYPIQAFSKQGSLIRCVVHKDLLVKVLCFCLDQQHKILVADTGTSEVKIFSNEGKLITKFGKEGSAPGEFTGLTGIAVDDLCSIVTVDEKEYNMIQIFSPL
ncbi:RING finger protein nhl-1-like [Oopsacas minuta]|uniref:RING finger protein nhl-1-like n=1 Tax=Oopsacas minuta TaxID=111878 RepID=A0AAV7K936_9METZ|nr:RING finger protein nhl-1-like [Oopsacas minuta]